MTVRRSLSVLAAAAVLVPLAATGPAGAAASAPATAASADVAAVRTVGTVQSSQKRKAKAWAATAEAKSARVCRSGDNYRLAGALGSGAYLMTDQRWRANGGKDFAKSAARAAKTAQDQVAWRVYRESGWKHLSCPTADWVQAVYSQDRGAVLTDLLIPGTHDSGAGLIRDTPKCDPQVILGANPFYKIGAEQNPCVAAGLAKAQDQNLGPQLKGGVRYLDMRVGLPESQKGKAPSKDPLNVPFVLEHGYVSQPLQKGLGQVLKFAAAHPKEQIILDFQHVSLTGDPALDEQYLAALDGVLHQFRPNNSAPTTCEVAWTRKAVPVADKRLGTAVPLRKAWRADRSILVLIEDVELPDTGCARSREAAIHSPWPNTEDPAVSKADNDAYLAERAQRLESGKCTDDEGFYWCGLFVNQLQLSAQPATQAQCVLNNVGDLCSLRALAALVNDKIAGYMRTWTNKGKPTNIEIMDFYEDADPSVVDELITLNWKRSGQIGTPGRG